MADRAPLPYDFMPTVPSFTVTSEDIAQGEMMGDRQVYNSFGMSGENISPQLSWSGFPAETRASRSPATTRTRRPVQDSGTGW